MKMLSFQHQGFLLYLASYSVLGAKNGLGKGTKGKMPTVERPWVFGKYVWRLRASSTALRTDFWPWEIGAPWVASSLRASGNMLLLTWLWETVKLLAYSCGLAPFTEPSQVVLKVWSSKHLCRNYCVCVCVCVRRGGPYEKYRFGCFTLNLLHQHLWRWSPGISPSSPDNFYGQ